jgi:nitrogen fixation protein FixH
MPQTPSIPRPSDRWIPWYIVGFFVLLVLTLVPMCVIAVRTNTGLVTDDAYDKGLAYNKTLQAEAQQDALKWRGTVNLTSISGDKVHADFSLTDADGQTLNNADVHLWLVRPTQDGMDQNLALKALPGGHYGADLTLPVRGLWEARASATLNGHNYQTVRRIVVP